MARLAEAEAAEAAAGHSLEPYSKLMQCFVRQMYTHRLSIAIAVLLVIIVRVAFWQAQFPDFTLFLDPWVEQLRAHGPGIVGSDFANYHPPYLYLIWLISLVVSDNLSVIKVASLLIDGLLAFSVYTIVGSFRIKPALRWLAAVGVLLLPTVIVNGAAWGQCDALYTAFLLLCVGAAMRGKMTVAWALFAASIAMKTQGIFLAPFMVFVGMRSVSKGRDLGAFIGVLVVLLAGPLLAGYTPGQLIQYYLADGEPMFGVTLLSWWLPNLMTWLPDTQFYFWRFVGIGLFAAVVVLAGYVGWKYRKTKLAADQLAVLATLSVLIVPFMLPQMHERYYFAAEVMMYVAAVAKRPWTPAVIGLQLVTLMSMALLFGGSSPKNIVFYVLSFGVLLLLTVLLRASAQYVRTRN